MKKKVDLNEVIEALAELGIDATVDEDLDGQIVIFTGMMPSEDDPDLLIPWEEM